MGRILVAEDHPHNRTVFAAVLQPLGHHVEFANDGQQALELLDSRPYDLMLLDVRMPRLDGYQVLERLRANPRHRGLPVVLVTADDAPEQRRRGFEVGATDFLSKPLDASLLVLRVKTHLELRTTSQSLLERNAQLEALQEQQRDFSAFIVHDLKSPLSVISANLQWIRSQVEASGAELVEAIDDSRVSAKRMLDLIGDLLVVSKLEEAGPGIGAQLTRVDVAALVDGARSERDREAQDRRVVLRAECPAGLNTTADPRLFRRLLDNLLDNALRHTPAGGAIAVTAKHDQGLELVVANTGTPIPVGLREHIFERYKRGPETSAAVASVGLGLYFSRMVAQAHGGTITVEESKDWPTMFRVRLPAAT